MKKRSYNLSKLAGNIKKYRKELGFSRDKVSKLAKVNYNTIIKLESGANKNPTIKTLIGLTNVFKKNLDDLLS